MILSPPENYPFIWKNNVTRFCGTPSPQSRSRRMQQYVYTAITIHLSESPVCPIGAHKHAVLVLLPCKYRWRPPPSDTRFPCPCTSFICAARRKQNFPTHDYTISAQLSHVSQTSMTVAAYLIVCNASQRSYWRHHCRRSNHPSALIGAITAAVVIIPALLLAPSLPP
jgi:hypothetical protein